MEGFQRLSSRSWFVRALIAWGVLCGACMGRAEDWIQLKTPHFTVISEASEGRTRDWAVQFELFRRAMMIVMPVDPAHVDPVTLVLFRSDRRLRPYKPMENGKPSRVAGFFVRLPARNTIAVAIEGARDDVREVIFHEAVHWHLAGMDRRLPKWVEEGLAEVMGNFRLSGNKFFIGSHRPEYLRYIKVAKPLPIAQMLALDEMQYNGAHGEMTQVFYCQSWALMHSIVFGDEGTAGVPKFAAFMQEPQSDRGFHEDIKASLGVSAENLEQRLKNYLERGKINSLSYPFDRSSVDQGFVVSVPPAGAVDMALGTLISGSGRGDEARPYFERAITARPDDARAHEGLAFCNMTPERMNDARVQFETAARLDNASYLSHAMLAEMAIRSRPPSRIAFGPPNYATPLLHLQKALTLNPRFLPASELLGLIVAMQSEMPSPEVQELVKAAAKRFPKSARVLLGLAHVQLRTSDMAGARETSKAVAKLGPYDSPELARLIGDLEKKLGSGGLKLLEFQQKISDAPPAP